MLSDEIEGNEITDPGIKFGRAFEVAEQESKAQDLETLADGERIGPIDVAEGLIGEEALRGKYRLAPLQKVLQRLVRHPYGRQYSTVSTILEG
jgi:hypothetical protein